MKSILAFGLFICVSAVAYSQGETNIWLSGHRAVIDFNSGFAEASERPYSTYIEVSNASICSKSGELLFYTNGYKLFNSNYDIMQNGDSLDCGEFVSQTGHDFMRFHDGVIIIPKPEDSSKYYLFHLDGNYYNPLGNSFGYVPNHLFYSIIDMTLDTGLGGVVVNKKNISVLNDTLTAFGMQAVRHGNGRDWWLFCHEYGSNRYYYFLIDPQGVHGPFTQSIGLSVFGQDANVASCARFSFSGDIYAHVYYYSNVIELYHFDRCTGVLNTWQSLALMDTFAVWPNYPNAVCFSPSDRFLYLSDAALRLYQFDLEALNVQSSIALIDVYDYSYNPFATWFDFMQNGPDGKIYMDEFNDNLSLHVINEPDSLGLACNFVQNAFQFDSGVFWAGLSMPNFPNYALDHLIGSSCDTLTTEAFLPHSSFTCSVYPNPCHNQAQFVLTGVTKQIQVELLNIFGQLLEERTLVPLNERVNHVFNLRQYPPGVYLLSCKTEKGNLSMKIMKE